MFQTIKKTVFAASFSILAASVAVANAQDISETHLSEARTAIAATKATDSFDSILLNASAGLKNQLTANDPNKADEISAVVDDQAIALAPRRGDLETEAARLFANTFSESELKEIAQFFASPTGQKYLDATPILARELGKSARVWANGISRDLNKNVLDQLAEQNKK